MSEPPRAVDAAMNVADVESRPVLGPAGNKATELRKPAVKPKSKVGKREEVKKSSSSVNLAVNSKSVTTPVLSQSSLRRKDSKLLKSNLSMNASCSSDASSDSSHSRASVRRSVTPRAVSGKQASGLKTGKVVVESDSSLEASPGRKRCGWVTANADPVYAVFHDEEWGVPVHDDKKLFELLSLSTALAELTWPAILNKRHLFREVFLGFDPVVVSKLNDKKITAPGNPATSLLSEVKLRGIIENARQVCKIADEFGSFDKYIWGFINHKPIVNKFRYPRQVPIKTSKADAISKDLVKRGFRGVGPTAVYSFLQVAGLTNDHLVNCFRFNECVDAGPVKDRADAQNGQSEERRSDDGNGLGLARVIDELRLSDE